MPASTDIGTKREVEFFHKKLKNPLFNQQVTLMPNLHLADQDIADIAVFLKSLKGRSLAEDPLAYRKRMKTWNEAKPTEIVATVESGKALVDGRGCLGCHKLADKDGVLFEGMMTRDKLHPALPGYQVWADGLKPILTELRERMAEELDYVPQRLRNG